MQLSSQKCISVGKRFSHGFKQVFSKALIHHMLALLRISHAACRRVGIHLASAIQNWGFKPKFAVAVPWWFRGRLAPAAPAPPVAPSVAPARFLLSLLVLGFFCYLPYEHSVYTICLNTFWPGNEVLFPSVNTWFSSAFLWLALLWLLLCPGDKLFIMHRLQRQLYSFLFLLVQYFDISLCLLEFSPVFK